MLSKKLWLPALVAFSMLAPASLAHAQEMGGGDEKKDEKKDEKPDEPKKPDEKPADTPKGDDKGSAKKTLAFDAKPDSFKDDKAKGGRGFVKHVFELDAAEGEQKAAVTVGFAGPKADYDKEKDRWVGAFEDKDGKKLDKSAVKEEAFEANGVKGKVAEVAGMFAPHVRGKKGEEPKQPEKKWTKVINVYLEGPDGGWIVRLQGGEKTVDKYKDDFMKYVKSVKIVDKTGDDQPKKEKKPKE